jgi:hypothetical protein
MTGVCRGAAIQRGVGPGRPAFAFADSYAPSSDARAKVFQCDESGLRSPRAAAERLSGAQSCGPATFGRTVVRPGDFRAQGRPRCAESPRKSRCGGSSHRISRCGGSSHRITGCTHNTAAIRAPCCGSFDRIVNFRAHSRSRYDFRAHSRTAGRRTGPRAKRRKCRRRHGPPRHSTCHALWAQLSWPVRCRCFA